MRVLAIFILFFLLVGSSACQAKKEYYSDYLIPDGYVGWVRAVHEVKGTPALPIENGRIVFKFDESGLLKTSDEVQEGWIYPRYYYYTSTSKTLLPYKAKGAGGMISGEGVSNGIVLHFFVGTEDQKSLWYESNCGKEKDRFGYLPQNTKQCLDKLRNSRTAR